MHSPEGRRKSYNMVQPNNRKEVSGRTAQDRRCQSRNAEINSEGRGDLKYNPPRIQNKGRKGKKMAKYVFPAVFTEEIEGGYSISFPDLDNCYTSAETLEEGMENALDVLTLMLYDREESGEAIPQASSIGSVKHNGNEFVTLIRCDTIEYRKFFDSKAVKKTLTVPAWLNTLAERAGLNFSAVLQKGLKAELNID